MSARLRLTLWYTLLFVVGGAVVLALNYALVDRSLTANPDEVRIAVAEKLGISPNEVRANERGEAPDIDDRTLFRQVQSQIAHDHLEHLLTESAIALAVMGLVSVGLGWLIAGRVLRPVHEMTSAARRLSETNLHERIDLHGPDDELKELADTFDAMLARLETAFDAQRRFVADASHELRTPLTVMRAEVDVTLADPDASPADLRAMAETVRDATERSESLIDSLLVLARSDSASLVVEPFDLDELVRYVLERLGAESALRGITIESSLEPGGVVGDRSLIERLVANLVENAIRHNVAGGWVTIATSRHGSRVELRVANGGPVLDAKSIEDLFRRFHRSAAARDRGTPGFGLGLSIVESVARAHHGDVEATPLPDGGLAVVVTFPASPVATRTRHGRAAEGLR